MTEPLKCAVCGVEMKVADADQAIATDAGPVHAECFVGPVPPGSTGAEAIAEAEEEAARRDHNDVPLSDYRTPAEQEEMEASSVAVNSNHPGGPTTTFDEYEPGDRRVEQMERDEAGYGGRYDEDGMGR
jgi:hypothetical protein